MSKYVEISVDRTTFTDTPQHQVSIGVFDQDGKGSGYRLLGPKYTGTSRSVARARLNLRDAIAIRGALDQVFPQPETEDMRQELYRLRAHVADCTRCAAVQDHDADKAADNR